MKNEEEKLDKNDIILECSNISRNNNNNNIKNNLSYINYNVNNIKVDDISLQHRNTVAYNTKEVQNNILDTNYYNKIDLNNIDIKTTSNNYLENSYSELENLTNNNQIKLKHKILQDMLISTDYKSNDNRNEHKELVNSNNNNNYQNYLNELNTNNQTVIESNTNKSNISYLGKKINNELLYTLVLDLDETLIHYIEEQDNAYIQVRPGAEEFLKEMSNYYELVIFTAAMEDVNILMLILYYI